MDENYYESLIENMSNVEIKESDREAFFDSFDAIKKESENPGILGVIIRHANDSKYIKDMLERMGFSSSNVDKVIEFLKKSDYVSSNEEVLDWLVNLDSEVFNDILYYFKSFILWDDDTFNKKDFPIYNYPIMRIMDYCLKHANFEKFSICTERLERWSLKAYFNVQHNLIEKCINHYRNNPEFLFLFSRQDPSVVKKYITESDIKNLTFPICKMLISQNILPIELINCSLFFEAFKSFSLAEQITITELLEGYDYDEDLINQLHKLFNKEELDKKQDKKMEIITKNILEVSPEYLIRLYEEIKNSSYFKKFEVEKDNFWLFIDDIVGKSPEIRYLDSLTEDAYRKLRELYEKCYRYATESIISSLYPLNNLTKKITYIDAAKYNILCRVQTAWDLPDLDESFHKRMFCGFSILTQDNFSHYPGDILHGYYSKVTPDLIAHIYPIDSLSQSWARYKKDISEKTNMLLDIDDLNSLTYANKTYNQLTMWTKTKEKKIITDDAIICPGDVDNKSLNYAYKYNKNILVLTRNKNTIEYNNDIYSHLQ